MTLSDIKSMAVVLTSAILVWLILAITVMGFMLAWQMVFGLEVVHDAICL